jgi:hypothetical protein
MAFPTKDGKKKFGSGFVAKRYDSMHPGESEPTAGPAKAPGGLGLKKASPAPLGEDNPFAAKPTPSAAMNPALGAEPDPNAQPDPNAPEDPQSTVAQHGAASNVTVHHSHSTGKHVVVSKHPDGHLHHSVHATAQDAHSAAKTLGGGAEPTQDENEPQLGEVEGAGAPRPRFA